MPLKYKIEHEGTESPLTFLIKMIKEEQVKELINSKLEGTEHYLLEVIIRPTNRIEVLIDSVGNLAIKDCVELSRYLEATLDREKEDFDLTVSSIGVDQPLRDDRQFVKNIGRQVKITTQNGDVNEGKLLRVEDKSLEIEVVKREKKLIGKGNHTVTKILKIDKAEIKETKIILSFK